MSAEPPAEGCLVELENIGRRFDGNTPVQALQNVDLKIRRGDWLAITGPSGAGKSTLLHILGCLDRPTAGRYYFEGIDTAALSDRERAGLRSRRLGFVFQSFHLLAHRTVLENVMLAEVYRKESPAGRGARAREALERVGLGHRVNFLPTKLSGGERQRVAIARAIMGGPSLLLCDEPTGNLDSKTGDEILEVFESLNRQGLTLVVVTHDERVAARARRRVQIIDGRLAGLEAFELQVDGKEPAEPPASRPVSRSGITWRDLLNESVAGMFARPGRVALTLLGIVIGLTALVATIGLSRTTGNRIISQFDELAATEVFVSGRSGPNGVDPTIIPWDAPDRMARLNGVAAVGTVSEVDVGEALVSASPIQDPRNQTAFNMAIKAASPGLFAAVRADLQTGRIPDLGHSERADRVAVLGPNAAARLGIHSVGGLPAIAIGDHVYLVIGVLSDVARQPDLLGAVIIPEGTARRDFGLVGPGAVVVETRIGAASLVARQAALALRPDNPALLKVEVPPEPLRVRDAVQSDLSTMLLLLGGLSLIVGAIGVGNITLVSVIERTGEIGLRRAIGATRRHIAAQFLIETTSMGVVGGVLGASIGVLIVVLVSAYQVWTPVLDPYAPILAPVVGGLIGLVSGTYPAWRAANLEPVVAFRN